MSTVLYYAGVGVKEVFEVKKSMEIGSPNYFINQIIVLTEVD